jgi:DNA-binding transcriptional MerR regulator
MADDDTPDTGSERLDKIEATQDRQGTVLDKILTILSGTHKESQQAVEGRLDAPGSVAEEVQRELERRDKASREAERDALLGKHDETLKGLTEKTPEPPVRKIESLMGWRG